MAPTQAAQRQSRRMLPSWPGAEMPATRPSSRHSLASARTNRLGAVPPWGPNRVERCEFGLRNVQQDDHVRIIVVFVHQVTGALLKS